MVAFMNFTQIFPAKLDCLRVLYGWCHFFSFAKLLSRALSSFSLTPLNGAGSEEGHWVRGCSTVWLFVCMIDVTSSYWLDIKLFVLKNQSKPKINTAYYSDEIKVNRERKNASSSGSCISKISDCWTVQSFLILGVHKGLALSEHAIAERNPGELSYYKGFKGQYQSLSHHSYGYFLSMATVSFKKITRRLPFSGFHDKM